MDDYDGKIPKFVNNDGVDMTHSNQQSNSTKPFHFSLENGLITVHCPTRLSTAEAIEETLKCFRQYYKDYLPREQVETAIKAAEKGSASPGRDNACFEIRSRLGLNTKDNPPQDQA